MSAAPIGLPIPNRGRLLAIVAADELHLHGQTRKLLRDAGIDVTTSAALADAPRIPRVLVLVSQADAPARVAAIVGAVRRHVDVPIVATMPADAVASTLRRAMRAGAEGLVLDD